MKHAFFTTKSTSSPIKIAYREWGPAEGPILLCVHGLTGNSQDFHFVGDYFAKHGYRVLAIDIPGRGLSDYINANDYNFDVYLQCLHDFLDYTGVQSCTWLGVSMGGLLGMRMASKENTKIERLILIDVGPEVPQSQIDFIAGYISLAPVFQTIEGVIGAMKQSIGTPFYRGPMTEAEWEFFARSSMRILPDGRYTRNSDPNIGYNFLIQPIGNTDLWDEWENIQQPTLVVRGELSLLLTIDIANEMHRRKKGAAMGFIEIADAGHVPSFYPEEQINLLLQWITKPSHSAA